MEAGKVTPVIDKAYPLNKTAEAMSGWKRCAYAGKPLSLWAHEQEHG